MEDMGDPMLVPSACLGNSLLNVKLVDMKQSSIPLIIYHDSSSLFSANVRYRQ